MQIELVANVKRWLQSKGEHVSVKTIHVNTCCAPPIQEIFIHLGKPEDYIIIKKLM